MGIKLGKQLHLLFIGSHCTTQFSTISVIFNKYWKDVVNEEYLINLTVKIRKSYVPSIEDSLQKIRKIYENCLYCSKR